MTAGTKSGTRAERTEVQEKSTRTLGRAYADQKRNWRNKNGSIKMKIDNKNVALRADRTAKETLAE
jgi:hypothetical protein